MDMNKMMRKLRVNARIAQMKTMKFAKDLGAKVNNAWNEAQNAANEYYEKVNEKFKNKEEENKCNCDCCHCHCHDVDDDMEEVQAPEEPKFDLNEFKEEMEYVEEENKDNE